MKVFAMIYFIGLITHVLILYNLIDMDLIFFKHNKHWEICTETFFRSALIKKKY